MKINLIKMTYSEGQQVKAAGAKWNNVDNVYCIEDHQKSDPVFSKFLPVENRTLDDLDPNPDWAGETENQIKTNPTPEAKKDEIAPATSSPEILEPVIEGSTPTTSVSEKPTKRTRGQIIDFEDSKIKKTYALSSDAISRCDRISKHFHMNLSSTIEKALKIAEKWIEENGKDAEIKMINNQNEQLLEVIEKFAKLQNQFQTSEEKHNKEIEALKNALAKNSVADIKNTNTQDYQKIDERIDKKISDALKNNVAQIPQSTPINFEKIDERVDKKMTEVLKKIDTNINTFRNFTQEWIEELDDRTGPMQVYFIEKGGWQTYIDKYTKLQNQGKTKPTRLPETSKEGGK